MKLYDMSALQLAKEIQSGNITATCVTRTYLDRIKRYNGRLNAFITICEEEALYKAEKIDEQINRKEILSPLMGVPIAIKDNILTKGIRTTAGSNLLKDYIPIYNATAVEKLNDAGLIIIGKTNLDEFGMGASGEKSAFGASSNPHNADMVSGGSSSGSAVAVASGLSPLALGSDTGGSVRLPASFCGVSGFKPSYGAVSRYGLIAFASSLDQIGVIGRNATDCQALFDIICGQDENDSTSADYKSCQSFDTIEGKTIGVPLQFLSDNVSDDVKNAFMKSLETMKRCGATVEFFDMPMLKYSAPIYHIISSAQASSNLARYDGVRYAGQDYKSRDFADFCTKVRTDGFGMEVKRRIITGTYVLSKGHYDNYYSLALNAQNALKHSFKNAFDKYDFIFGLTSPDTAFKKGEKSDSPVNMYLLDEFTASVNLASLPAVSVPCGYDKNNLPIGMQIIGNRFCDKAVMQIADFYQKATGREICDIPSDFWGNENE